MVVYHRLYKKKGTTLGINERTLYLLQGWEDVFKKGQLTLWIMLALKDGDKHMAVIKAFINQATEGNLSADDRSMYRALGRYNKAGLIDFKIENNDSGPDRKVYRLTPMGRDLLGAFLERNITNVFYKPSIRKLIEGKEDE
jgi:PadR family transcriptional regulator, regulatory protein PadR